MTKKMKARNIVIYILVCLLVVFTIFTAAVSIKINYIPVEIENDYHEIYATPFVSIESENEDFKVLKISDTHLINGKTKEDLKTLVHIEAALNKSKYDLIIFNGDLVAGFSINFSFNKYAVIDSVAAIVERYRIPWTFVPGNNDREMQGNNKKMISYFMQYEHFIVGNTEGIDGDVNFIIHITRKRKIAHSIFLLDSHSRKIPVIGDYDHIKESQIKYVREMAKRYNNFISVFFHKPTPMFQKANNEGALCPNYNQSVAYPFDQIKEGNLFDEGIANCSNISLISSSHVHSNNMLSLYNGRYYEANSASGFGADCDDSVKPVVTEININLLSTTVKNLYKIAQ